MLQEAKDLQLRAVNDLVSATSLKDVVTFKAPTGSGKTFMMAMFMEKILEKEKDVVFIVSSLSKAKLAEQNYEKFKSYYDHGFVRLISPYLINSENTGENALFIPNNYNVYVLPRDLYKEKSKLKGQQAFLRFIQEITKKNQSSQKDAKRIYLIKDECHIATKNLDELQPYFSKVINISATPKEKAQVEISETDAVSVNLIKSVEFKGSTYKEDNFTVGSLQYKELKDALDKLLSLKTEYTKFNLKPCLIIQLSNSMQGVDQLNVIMQLLEESKYKELHWLCSADDPNLCKTNDNVIKASKDKWEKYATSNDSLIDIIIFKMKITEGWDIPRACMLFQIRDSQSKQLDEQVIGRVRRNPLLLDFENIKNPNDKKLLTTAYAWGIKEKSKNTSLVDVHLKGKTPDDMLNISNEIQQEFKLKITKLLDNISTVKSGFDIRNFLEKQPKQTTTRSIFELYESLQSSNNKVQEECKNFINNSVSDPYTAFFAFTENLDTIKSKLSDKLKDYKNCIEIVKNSFGKDLEVTLPFNSLYVKNNEYSLTINNTVWDNDDPVANFTFDSDSEREWLNKLLNGGFKIKEIPLSNDKQIYLIGKNYLPNSDIRYEYYNDDGRHFSYPDFVMKSEKDEYFIFEVKSLNQSSSLNINKGNYKNKISSLEELYQAVSSKIDNYFCLPIKIGDTWNILCFYKGGRYNLDESTLKDVVNGSKSIFDIASESKI